MLLPAAGKRKGHFPLAYFQKVCLFVATYCVEGITGLEFGPKGPLPSLPCLPCLRSNLPPLPPSARADNLRHTHSAVKLHWPTGASSSSKEAKALSAFIKVFLRLGTGQGYYCQCKPVGESNADYETCVG